MTETAASVGRDCWALLESIHITAYFAPEPAAAYKALGLRSAAGYFASRSAPMGAVPAEVTTATFYVFSPGLVGHFIPAAWEIATPAQILEARHTGMTQVLHRGLGSLPEGDVAEALKLSRVACETLLPQGRPLYAGHASLPWPEDPLLALWHAASLLREHRGDGHVATLLTHELGPLEALVTYAQAGGNEGFLKLTRGWSEEEWQAGVERCRVGGLVDAAGVLTDLGHELRASVEDDTDRLAAAGWQHLGLDGCLRLRELLTLFRQALADAAVFPPGVLDSKR